MEEMCKTGLQQITSEKEEGMEEKRKGTDTTLHEISSNFSAVVASMVAAENRARYKVKIQKERNKREQSQQLAITHLSMTKINLSS